MISLGVFFLNICCCFRSVLPAGKAGKFRAMCYGKPSFFWRGNLMSGQYGAAICHDAFSNDSLPSRNDQKAIPSAPSESSPPTPVISYPALVISTTTER